MTTKKMKTKAVTKRTASRAKKSASEAKYVAVVMRKGTNYSNRQPHKDWSCFTDAKKEDAVRRALAAARSWSQRYGEYDILVGRITELVHIPVQFEFEKI